jgi:hypothetical protein
MSKNSDGFFSSRVSSNLPEKKVLACVYDYRRDCIPLYSGVRAGPEQCRCRSAPVPGCILLLFTFLCEEIPGMCMEWSSFIRVRGCFLRIVPVEGTGVMVRSHEWQSRRLVPGFQREYPARMVSMGSPWHLPGIWYSRTQPCRSSRIRLQQQEIQAYLPRA